MSSFTFRFGDLELLADARQNNADFALQGTSAADLDALERGRNVFVVGSYKAGKTSVVQWLTENKNIQPHAVENTKGEVYYPTTIKDADVMFVDTEGFFQPVNPNKLNVVQDILLAHVTRSCDYLVWVVDRLFDFEFEVLCKIFDMFGTESRIQNMVVIYNRKDIRQEQDLEQYVAQVKKIFPPFDNPKSKFKFKSKEGKRTTLFVDHIFLGAQETFAASNHELLNQLRKSIQYAPMKPWTTTLTGGIQEAVRAALFQYYKFGSSGTDVTFDPQSQLRVDNPLVTRGQRARVRQSGQWRLDVILGDPEFVSRAEGTPPSWWLTCYVLCVGLTQGGLEIEAVDSRTLLIHARKPVFPQDGKADTIQLTQLVHLPTACILPTFQQNLNLHEDPQNRVLIFSVELNMKAP